METHKSFADVLCIALIVALLVMVLCPPIYNELKRQVQWLLLTRKIRRNRK